MARSESAGALFSELVLEVFRLNGRLLEAGDALTAPEGLTSARWQVLGVVDHGPAPVAAVARTMGLTRQSVQLTADALEAEGFVTYRPNPHHQRAKLICLTPEGERALRAVEARQARWAQQVGAQAGVAALRDALRGLRRVREALEPGEASDG
jgi:DNA-binding MarR family transcriptional regulator